MNRWSPRPQRPVLNVNDDEATLYFVTQILRRDGFVVVEARSGDEAMRLAAEVDLGLVILDIGLPDMSGIEVRRRLRSDPRTKHLKILHTSASFSQHDARVASMVGDADGILLQPFEPEELLARVHALLDAESEEEQT